MLIECRICFVDPRRLLCDAISFDGNSFIQNIAYTNTGLKRGGTVEHPEIGDVIIVDKGAGGDAKLHHYYGARRTDKETGLPSMAVGQGSTPGVQESLPGDRSFYGPDGAFLSLLRGGFASMGSAPLCQTIYLALEGLVRTVCLNQETFTAGSRIYTITDDGKVVTRACFNSKDSSFSKGANENPMLESENFEYQIDIVEDGLTLFVGELGDDNKRKNNFMMTIKRNGELHMTCGENVIFNLFGTGIASFKIVGNDKSLLYDKTVSVNSGSDKVVVKEIVKGDYIRQVNGHVYDEITGTLNQKCDMNITMANVIEESASMNRKTSGMNVNEIATVPDASVTVR